MRGVAALVLLLAGCPGGEDDAGGAAPSAREGDAEVGGEVVATVDGVPIGLDDVRRVLREGDLRPREALARLEEEELLAAEARRRGYRDDPAVRYAARKAMVQALLEREIERAITPATIPEERVREQYERRDDWARPERRASAHVLAKTGPGADPELDRGAERFAARVLHELAFAEDPQQILERYRESEDEPFEVTVEEIPPVARDASFAEPYLEAVFDVDRAGPVDVPVRTRYGWHAILVTEIVPARDGSFESVQRAIREQLASRDRQKRLVELVGELRRRTVVQERSEVIDRALRGPAPGKGG